MAVAEPLRSTDQDVRVQDYLDDKLQALSDFDTLDSLLDNVKAHQEILKKQLSEVQRDHEAAQQASRDHAVHLQQKARAFQEEQEDIDRRVMAITQSETSDEAARRFEGAMNRLHRLDVAVGYAKMLKEVDELSTQCTEQLGKSDEAALRPYQRLQTLVATLSPLQEAAEGAAPHLLDHIARTAETVRKRIQHSFSVDLENTLKKTSWPKPEATIPQALQQEWSTNVGRLLELQKSELEAVHRANFDKISKDEPVVLLPLEIMLRPLAQRFQYHFSGDKPTNRLDKPEYFFSHVLDLLNTYSSFCQTNLQPLLALHFRNSDLLFTPAYFNATSALITALLPWLRSKLSAVLSQVSSQPNLFSNLIHEVIAFDTSIAHDWAYAPLSPSTPFRGLAHHILSTLSYFPAWLAVERDFALSRYDAIISDRSTGQLDYDSVDASATKPSKAAILVNDLLETITERYRPLASFTQKITFLIDIQIAIFDRFHHRLHESLEAYLTRTSAVARTVHGVSREDGAELVGVKGLDRLCRVYGSAEYLEKAMRDWSDDVFFLELWEELQYRSKHAGSIAADLTLQEITAKTRTSMTDGDDNDAGLQGALFDETATSYQRLRIRSEHILTETITYAVRDAMRPYIRLNPWASLSASTVSANGEPSLTAELDPPLRLLDEYLAFLSKALAKAPLRRISRQLALSLQALLWDSGLVRHQFSTAGAAQFTADVQGICRVMDRYVGTGQGSQGMRRLMEGLVLLGLPVRGEIPVEIHAGDGAVESDGKMPGLWEVERRVFMDNESARDVLEEMGLSVLSESDARAVLERRIELAS